MSEIDEGRSGGAAAALAELWGRWAQECADLSDEQWAAPTRCGDWDVAALTAHVSGGVAGMRALLEDRRVGDEAELHTAAQIIRVVKPSADVAYALARKVAVQASEDATRTSAADLVARFRSGEQVCLRAAAEPDGTADYFGRGIATIEAAAELRVVEAAVHLLDLLAALGREPDVPAAGLRVTVGFLVELVPSVEFVEAATGRRAADFFPVHS